MPKVDDKSINSKSRGKDKFGKKITRKMISYQKQSSYRNRVVRQRKINYSPEYHQKPVQILYYSDEHKPVVEQQ